MLNEKVQRNAEVWMKLNAQWQDKMLNCRCDFDPKKVFSNWQHIPEWKSITLLISQNYVADQDSELYKFTAEQQMLLGRFILPDDANKYVAEMASFLFDATELKTKTAAKLEPSKIAFMSRKSTNNEIHASNISSENFNLFRVYAEAYQLHKIRVKH